eukprot:scaffold1640_cov161-Amphora_coffeaeformis.AAC.21
MSGRPQVQRNNAKRPQGRHVLDNEFVEFVGHGGFGKAQEGQFLDVMGIAAQGLSKGSGCRGT